MKAILLSIALLTQLFYTNKACAENPDSSSILIKRFRIGIDILKPWGYILRSSDSIAKKSYRVKFEVLTAYQISELVSANLDLGYGKGVEYAYQGAQRYQSQGVYFKPGIDLNLVRSNVSFLLGYRLGLSSFLEKNQYLFHSHFWNSDYVEEKSWKSFGYWHELLASIRVVLFRTEKQAFSLGFTPRLRAKPRKPNHTQLFIPGYGGNNPFNLALNIDFAIAF